MAAERNAMCEFLLDLNDTGGGIIDLCSGSTLCPSGSLSEVTREFICPLNICGYDYWDPA